MGPGCRTDRLKLLSCQMEQNSTTLKLQPLPSRHQHWVGRDRWKVQTTLDGESPFHANTAMGLSCCGLGQRQR